ncbi:NAD(P)-binding domain-containing protein [Chondromyces crocatus]|uniref:NAD(P)-binding domain-containing protein n=1 Tax=Chondromyces crocatus TaxID=52 RepID=UPI00067B69C2|nr:NAD(P)-binding domain-containing protein [Chondromyces crocatus]
MPPTEPSGRLDGEPSGPPPAGSAPRPGHSSTLYRAEVSDPRARAAQPREPSRGRAARRSEATSDVTRFQGVLAATLVGAAAAAVAALVFPPPGGHGSAGPLSRPHVQAGLSCASCHAPTDSRLGDASAGAAQKSPAKVPGAVLSPAQEPPSAARACPSCHGAHGSTRPGHQQQLARGNMTCATCHTIHRGDQGVVLRPDAPPLRFAPGAEAEVEGGLEATYRPTREATVALVTAGSCVGCHDLGAPRDPVARCLPRDGTRLGNAQPVVCFDEHQLTLPEIESESARRARLGEGVCRAQHTDDRALAWTAAREIARATPEIPGVIGSAAGRSLGWAGTGLGAAMAWMLGERGLRRWRERRRKRAPMVSASLLRPAERVRLPQIDTSTCLGCYACVDACPYDVLAIERYVAVVARPEACCGLTLCEQRCPNGSLTITDGARRDDRPDLDDDLQSVDMPGLYLAGDITGLPLIKNAIQQGARATERAAMELRAPGLRKAAPWAGRGGDRGSEGDASTRDEPLDLIIVGAGPAGISAALRAKELGLRFDVIEQGSVAASIRSFPRGKLVFDQPLDLPITGKLWLQESTKEELLAQWLRVVRQERLPILEQTRMISMQRDPTGEGFVMVTEPVTESKAAPGTAQRTERRARRVVLAIGQRGSPRRLPVPVPSEVEDRVYYHLADARSLAGTRVLVVGLGDVAMEAAIALARQPGTTVTLAARADGFRRGRTRNIDEVQRLATASRLTLALETHVAALASAERSAVQVTLASPRGRRGLLVDAVLVLIGSIPPWDTLRAAGVRVGAATGEGGTSAKSTEPLATPRVEEAGPSGRPA